MKNNPQAIIERIKQEAEAIPGLMNSSKVKRLVEWIGWELATLYTELRKTKDDIYNLVVERLFPEINSRAIPGHAAVLINPIEPYCILSHKEVLSVEDTKIYLSPLFDLKLFNGKIRYQIANNKIWEYESPLKKNLIAGDDSGKFNLPLNSIWIGLELHQAVDNINGLSFWFDGTSKEIINLLPYSKFEVNGNTLDSIIGLKDWRDMVIPLSPDNEFFHIHDVKKGTFKEYESQFITIQMDEDELVFNEYQSDSIPGSFKEHICLNSEKNLLWIKITFSENLPDIELDRVEININVVPTWNIREDISKDNVADSRSMCLALTNIENEEQTNEFFFGIHRVWSDQNFNFKPTMFNTISPGHYAVQETNISEFNTKEATLRIIDLIHLLEEYNIQIGENEKRELALNLKDLNSSLQQLQERIDNLPQRLKTQSYYINIVPSMPGEMLFVEYLNTQGENFNRSEIRKGNRIQSINEEQTLFDKGVIITRPNEGSNPISREQKEIAIRQLLSQNFEFKSFNN